MAPLLPPILSLAALAAAGMWLLPPGVTPLLLVSCGLFALSSAERARARLAPGRPCPEAAEVMVRVPTLTGAASGGAGMAAALPHIGGSEALALLVLVSASATFSAWLAEQALGEG